MPSEPAGFSNTIGVVSDRLGGGEFRTDVATYGIGRSTLGKQLSQTIHNIFSVQFATNISRQTISTEFVHHVNCLKGRPSLVR